MSIQTQSSKERPAQPTRPMTTDGRPQPEVGIGAKSQELRQKQQKNDATDGRRQEENIPGLRQPLQRFW